MNLSSRQTAWTGVGGRRRDIDSTILAGHGGCGFGACDRLHFAAFTAEESDRSGVDPAMELATEAVPRVAQASGGDSAVAEQ